MGPDLLVWAPFYSTGEKKGPCPPFNIPSYPAGVSSEKTGHPQLQRLNVAEKSILDPGGTGRECESPCCWHTLSSFPGIPHFSKRARWGLQSSPSKTPMLETPTFLSTKHHDYLWVKRQSGSRGTRESAVKFSRYPSLPMSVVRAEDAPLEKSH